MKDGREHEHRTYLRTRADGTAIRLDHDFQRREKIGRIIEFERGEAFVRGAHNRAVISALEAERPEIAQAMRDAGLHEGRRPVAPLTPEERNQQERTRVPKSEIARLTALAWHQSDSGTAFVSALAEQGLRLSQGDKCPVLIDESGNIHALDRMFKMHSRASGDTTPTALEIKTRLTGLEIPTVKDAKAEPIPAPRQPNPAPAEATPAPGLSQTPAQASESPTAPFVQTEPLTHEPAQQAHSAHLATMGNGATSASQSGAPVGYVGYTPETIDGPCDAPGPGAGPQEIQQYRARLYAYEQKRANARTAQNNMLKQHGDKYVQQNQNHSSTPTISTASTSAWPSDSAGAKQRNDDATSGTYQKPRKYDSENSVKHRRSADSIARTDSAPSIRKPEPDIRHSYSPNSVSREPAQDRANARKIIEKRATEVRLIAGLKALPNELKTLRRAINELNPEWREARDVQKRLADDRAKIAIVLASRTRFEPWELDPQASANAYAGRISDAVKQRETVAKQAEALALAGANSRSLGTRLLAIVGLKTAEQRHAEKLIATAEKLAGEAQRLPARENYTDARRDGEKHAHTAQKAVMAWENRPDVARALENRRLNSLVQDGIRAGDQAIADAIKAGNPEGAREILREREREQLKTQRKDPKYEINNTNDNKGPQR